MKVILSGKSKDKHFLVDDEDFLRVSSYTWWQDRLGRPQTDIWNKDTKTSKRVLIGRFIMLPPDNLVVDHKNGNQLDNRKCNLRICTRKQNQRNRTHLNKNSTSGFRGISWDKYRKKWVAQLSFNYRHIYLGRFVKIEDARKAVQNAITKKHKEYSNLKTT